MRNAVKMNLKFASALACAVAAFAPAYAQAADFDKDSQVVVRYSDLDLRTEAGARTLLSRLNRAADSVCPDDSISLVRHLRYKTCVNQAVGGAVRSANLDALNKLYAERTGLNAETHLSMNLP